MFPYGLRPGQWKDEDCGPPSRIAKMTGKNRTTDRRLMHKSARNAAKRAIKVDLKEQNA